jgi:hypothetical protein
LEGTRTNPVFIDKGRLVVDPNTPTPQRMLWFDQNFVSIIAEYDPHRVCYRLFWKTNTLEQAGNFHFPYGILNLVCYQRGLEILEIGHQAITARRLSLPRGTNLMSACDNTIGEHPPYWDDTQRQSALVAWIGLDQ